MSFKFFSRSGSIWVSCFILRNWNSGITESSISRHLHSERRPRMDIVVNVAKALDVDIDYLLDEGEHLELAYTTISTAIARKGGELTTKEKNKLIALILGSDIDA